MTYPFQILALFLIAVTPIQGEESTRSNQKKPIVVTLNDVSVAKDSDTEHPLVCGLNRDYPKGRELLVNQITTKTSTHVVFPKKSDFPQDVEGMFNLSGYYQGIQTRSAYPHKIPSKAYRYFVVTSWERNGPNKPNKKTLR